MTRRPLLVASLVILGAAASRADGFEIERGQVFVALQGGVGGKEISFVSRSLEWSILQLDEVSARVQLRVPSDSFDSGHPQLDSTFRSGVVAALHPFIELDGEVRSGRFEGTVSVRGVSKALAMPFSLVRDDGHLVVSTAFAIDLRDFGIEFPPVDDRVSVELVARLPAAPRAVLSGGGLAAAD